MLRLAPRQIWANCGGAHRGKSVYGAERIAFPLGKVARCGAARTVTDEGRPPAAGVLGAAVISEGSSVGLYPAAHRAAYFPLCYAIFFTLSRFILQNLKIFFKSLLTK